MHVDVCVWTGGGTGRKTRKRRRDGWVEEPIPCIGAVVSPAVSPAMVFYPHLYIYIFTYTYIDIDI